MITNARKNTYASMRAIHKFTNSIVLKTQRTYRLEDHFFIHVKILKFQFFFCIKLEKTCRTRKRHVLVTKLENSYSKHH